MCTHTHTIIGLALAVMRSWAITFIQNVLITFCILGQVLRDKGEKSQQNTKIPLFFGQHFPLFTLYHAIQVQSTSVSTNQNPSVQQEIHQGSLHLPLCLPTTARSLRAKAETAVSKCSGAIRSGVCSRTGKAESSISPPHSLALSQFGQTYSSSGESNPNKGDMHHFLAFLCLRHRQ